GGVARGGRRAPHRREGAGLRPVRRRRARGGEPRLPPLALRGGGHAGRRPLHGGERPVDPPGLRAGAEAHRRGPGPPRRERHPAGDAARLGAREEVREPTGGGVVGYGSVGRKQAAEMAVRVRSLGIVDTSEPARRAAAEDHPGARVAVNLEALDAVDLPWGSTLAVIATWGPTHAALFHALVDRGVRRILAEKPLAASVCDAFSMADRAARDGVRLEVHHYFRYGGLVESLRGLL